MIPTALAVRLRDSVSHRLGPLRAIPWLRGLGDVSTFVVLLLLGVKASVDLDRSWDTSSYHHPFAARLWDIIPPGEFRFHPHIEEVWQGFPRLGEFVQGFFWYMTGRPESTNLLSYLVFVAFVLFLKARYRVPPRWSAFALLAVPMIQIHVTTSYIDWVGNILVTIAMLLTYDLVLYRPNFSWRDLAGFVFCSAAACNIKFSYIPAIGMVTLIWTLYYFIEISKIPALKLPHRRVMWLLIPLVSVLFLIVPIKNTFEYGIPLYPITYQHYQVNRTPVYLANSGQFVRYAVSLIEYKALEDRPHLWSVDQGSVPKRSDQYKMGGYFGAYFLFNLLLLCYIACYTKKPRAIWGLLFVAGALLLNSQIGSSQMLRYLMYVFTFLIAINLRLLAPKLEEDPVLGRGIRPMFLIGVASSFVFVVAVTGAVYLIPTHAKLENLMEPYRSEIRSLDLKRGEMVCVVGGAQETIYYTAYFTRLGEYRLESVPRAEQCESGSIQLIAGEWKRKARRSSTSKHHRRQL